ncbi:MAG: RNA-binding S4 domain-containing protein [Hyphomicrobiales bacterium]|nr:RNA-binding S4 domain-containing protein [Hyphomicrobiales bacterium]
MAVEGLQNQAQRLDKWLWHARLTKSRSMASKLIADGKVRVNRDKILKPSQTVKVGDVFTLIIRGHLHAGRVLSMTDRRVGPSDVNPLYEDLSPSIAESSRGQDFKA